MVIAAERGQLAIEELRERLAEQRVAFAAITASELLHGVHRAKSSGQRQRRARFVDGLLGSVGVLAFDLEVARTHAAVWADLARAGTPIGAHDLQIAATALAHDLVVATRKLREFERVDGLGVELW